ncbi:MAG: hypothetical protein JST19_20530 [Bacteroidetes bacterium]|nr:hypothetical protein [Bacteroidota bacterium]
MAKCFERFFMEYEGRPLPKAPTHMVVADILNKDLSIKRVTIYFNPDDQWLTPRQESGLGGVEAVGKHIGDYLGFIGLDKAAQYYRYWIVEIATNEVVIENRNGFITSKVHYAIDEDKFNRV